MTRRFWRAGRLKPGEVAYGLEAKITYELVVQTDYLWYWRGIPMYIIHINVDEKRAAAFRKRCDEITEANG